MYRQARMLHQHCLYCLLACSRSALAFNSADALVPRLRSSVLRHTHLVHTAPCSLRLFDDNSSSADTQKNRQSSGSTKTQILLDDEVPVFHLNKAKELLKSSSVSSGNVSGFAIKSREKNYTLPTSLAKRKTLRERYYEDINKLYLEMGQYKSVQRTKNDDINFSKGNEQYLETQQPRSLERGTTKRGKYFSEKTEENDSQQSISLEMKAKNRRNLYLGQNEQNSEMQQLTPAVRTSSRRRYFPASNNEEHDSQVLSKHTEGKTSKKEELFHKRNELHSDIMPSEQPAERPRNQGKYFLEGNEKHSSQKESNPLERNTDQVQISSAKYSKFDSDLVNTREVGNEEISDDCSSPKEIEGLSSDVLYYIKQTKLFLKDDPYYIDKRYFPADNNDNDEHSLSKDCTFSSSSSLAHKEGTSKNDHVAVDDVTSRNMQVSDHRNELPIEKQAQSFSDSRVESADSIISHSDTEHQVYAQNSYNRENLHVEANLSLEHNSEDHVRANPSLKHDFQDQPSTNTGLANYVTDFKKSLDHTNKTSSSSSDSNAAPKPSPSNAGSKSKPSLNFDSIRPSFIPPSNIVPQQRVVPRTVQEFSELLNQKVESPPDSRLIKVALLGLPNSGKSTLVNALSCDKVCSVSRRVHTTEYMTRAVSTIDSTQIVILDTPGIVTADHALRHSLSDSMMHDAERSIPQADVLVVVVDSFSRYTKLGLHPRLLRLLALYPTKPAILVLNKVDLVKKKKNMTELLLLTRLMTGGKVDRKDAPGKHTGNKTESPFNESWPAEAVVNAYLDAHKIDSGKSNENLHQREDVLNGKQHTDPEFAGRTKKEVSWGEMDKQWHNTAEDYTARLGSKEKDFTPAEVTSDVELTFEEIINKNEPIVIPQGPRSLLKRYSVGRALNEEDVFAGRLKLTEEEVNDFVEGRRGWPLFQRVVRTCARSGDGVDDLRQMLLDLAPRAPWMFPSTYLTDQDPVQITVQTVREKFMNRLLHQLPYSLRYEVETWEMLDANTLQVVVRVTCERESMVSLLVGSGGCHIIKLAKMAEVDLANIFKVDVKLGVLVSSSEITKPTSTRNSARAHTKRVGRQ